MSVSENLASIQEKIEQACVRANRQVDEITVIGVTKYVTIERTEELIAAGITNIGENRTEELLHKYEVIQDKADFHFIGTLQSRKVKEVIGKVKAIHSLDRLSIAKQINNRSHDPVDCFLQVNVSGEESKHGLKPEDVLSFIKELQPYEKVKVVGLMTMAPHVDDEQEIRSVFRRLAIIRDEVMREQISNAPCNYLSMGMSNDYEIAIEEGATHIRIGSKLVG
ncbi:YggS family pyridoxal phosphate-dependent enzyme [Pseudogracilibacillus sp. SE30717A]|uniref:YggS family pyridoxal phosphate-dependent enzyme n=1 Tax=Pseudogracilibacillus sp. SE30717A TaxID=3098293 RepID=UPI00300DC689